MGAKAGGQVGDWLGLDGNVVRRCTYPLATLPPDILDLCASCFWLFLFLFLFGVLVFFFTYSPTGVVGVGANVKNYAFFAGILWRVCCAWVLIICYGWREGGPPPEEGGKTGTNGWWNGMGLDRMGLVTCEA